MALHLEGSNCAVHLNSLSPFSVIVCFLLACGVPDGNKILVLTLNGVSVMPPRVRLEAPSDSLGAPIWSFNTEAQKTTSIRQFFFFSGILG